jgi:hypothetical protein
MVFALGLSGRAHASQSPPFAEFAEAFRKEHKIETADPTDFDAQALLSREWLSARVGVFEMLYPRAGLENKPRQEELKLLLGCVLDQQAQWVEWFGVAPASTAVRQDLTALKRWVGSARTQPFKLKNADLGLMEFLGAGDKELATAARIAAAFDDGSVLGYKQRGEQTAQLIFAPTRLEFMHLVAFFGWVDPERQATFWDDGAAKWSETYWNSIQVLSLEDPPSKPNPKDPWAGTSMSAKEPTGVVEHVASRATHSLCTAMFGYGLDPAFESGLCQNVAIALYGRNNSRSGGSGRGHSTDGWSMFIPGGNSNGGMLPGISADSIWRSTAGSDWFVKPLKDSQRVASKDASMGREKTSTFEVTANDRVKKLFVRAPFLGQAALGKELPADEFLSDYLEFFRAYKSCFVHWLHEEGGGKNAKLSHAKLAELLRNVAAAPEGAMFEELLSSCYGMPWSSTESKPESLEWDFLAWLSRQK